MPARMTQKAPTAMDNDKRIFFDFGISGKWLYPSYAFTYAAIAAIMLKKTPNTNVNNAVLFWKIVFINDYCI